MDQEKKVRLVKELGTKISEELTSFFTSQAPKLPTQEECEVSLGVIAGWLQTLVAIFENKDDSHRKILEHLTTHVLKQLEAKESNNEEL